MGGETRKNYSDGLAMKNEDQRSFTIRKLQAKDLPQVVAIQRFITQKRGDHEQKSNLKEHLNKVGNLSLVAVEKNLVVGFVISEVMTNSFGLDKSGWIINLGVLPQYMGKGIGQSLANHLFDLYRKQGITEIYSTSRWDWGDLLSFFKSLGFDRSSFINLYKKLDS
ncbi:MAG: N-acetyltransferase [Desulfobacca sp.]|nr:N-acetyltransferase [Desulfobacca sp.]